ncbi:MEDS domain-containing protein [Caldovatus sediminis]|uniref:MEDS domain-containing protein n=1 Tax=Caldovatus sediminis TaxID=2041189 RepID=UPI003571779B
MGAPISAISTRPPRTSPIRSSPTSRRASTGTGNACGSPPRRCAPPTRRTDALRNAVPDLDARIRRGQIEILDHEAWYGHRVGKVGADAIIAGWLRRKGEALARGRSGFRLAGNTSFLEAADRDSFAEYEARVNACFCDHRVVALCSYCAGRCDAGAAMDVVQNHGFALARRRGAWTMIESGSVKLAREELRRLNAELKDRVAERTAGLAAALAERDALLRELHHRVKNNLQVVASLLGLKARQFDAPEVRSAFGDTLRRSRAMSLAHEALCRPPAGAIGPDEVDFGAYLRALGRATADSFGLGSRVAIEVAAEGQVVGLDAAVPLGPVAAEAVTNACKHAFPGGRAGRPRIVFRAPAGGGSGELVVRDDGVGMPPGAAERDGAEGEGAGGRGRRRGAGIALVEGIARQVRGRGEHRAGRP